VTGESSRTKSPAAGDFTDRDGGRVQIGELARLTGVPVKTIRYYSDLGVLSPAARTGSRYRLYGPDDRVRLEQIRILRELGFGLDAIAALMGRGPRAGRGADPRPVIEAQLAAVERQRSHLARAATVLRAALAGGDPAATTLRVGAVLRLAAWERAGVMREHVAAPLRGTAVDPQFLERLLDAAFGSIPAELDDEQWAAFVELVALISDPSFGTALAAQAEPFWQKARGFDVASWQRDWGALLQRGVAVLARGGRPADVEAQQLAQAYLAMVARAMKRRPSDVLARWTVEQANAHDPRGARFWELVAALHKRPPSPHAAVMGLVLDALRARLDGIAARPTPSTRVSRRGRARR
jgi:DNA-binding transcriptional MerR regulator